MNLSKLKSRKVETQAIKRNIIFKLPWNLIINLKRFAGQMSCYAKSTRDVSIKVIKMDKYTMEEVCKDDKEIYDNYKQSKISDSWNDKHIYELYGIVSHGGGMGGGHYVSYVLYKLGSKRYWYYCSDSRVSNIDENDVLKAEAYMLFYRKLDKNEEN